MARPKRVSDHEALGAAARVIGRRGPVDFTVREVAQEAGLAPATIMQRFRTKRGLLLAIEQGSREKLASLFDAATARAPTPSEAIALALCDSVRGLRSAREMANHMAFLAVGLNDDELARQTQAYFALLRKRVAALVREAKGRGELSADVDPEAHALLVEVAFNGALSTWAIERHGAIDALVRTALRPILPLAPLFPRGARGKAGERTLSKDARRPADPDP